jgi:YhcH/YjgK/YiaL family protein
MPAGTYDPGRDIEFFTDRPDVWIPVKPGQFVVFFPEDAHAPLVGAGEIHKIVVKVAAGSGCGESHSQ